MTSIKDIEKCIDSECDLIRSNIRPIYEICVFENPNKELVSKSGKCLGWPDMGAQAIMGFYYDIQDAIDVLHMNLCDIRETVYDAAFILCRFPGLYNEVGTNRRMYFVWNDEKQGYFQAEEPEIFKHISL